MLKLLRLRY